MAEDHPDKWRWYHHVILVLGVAVFAAVWSLWLKPSERVADIVLVLCAVGFVVTFTAVQIRKRRQRKV